MAVATEQQETSTFQEMTDEQQAIVEMVRSFVDKEIIPNARSTTTRTSSPSRSSSR